MANWLRHDLQHYERAWAESTGEGVRIAVLDSGISCQHPALAGLQLADDCIIACKQGQWRACPGNGEDPFGHGTAIASIIHQLAPAAELGSFRILGPTQQSRTVAITAAVREAVSRGYHIIHASFGCPDWNEILYYKAWTDGCFLRDVAVVAAADRMEEAEPEWPAHFLSVAAVGASEKHAPLGTIWKRQNRMVSFTAPGHNLTVPWADGREKNVSGSSFAAPQLTARYARLLASDSTLTPSQLQLLSAALAEG